MKAKLVNIERHFVFNFKNFQVSYN